jgi:putative inorganic carbon (hco3(-)) transporter
MALNQWAAREKIAQYALCLLVGALCGGILLLQLGTKWEIAVLGVLGISVLMLATKSPERVLLCLLAFTVPLYMGKAILDRPESTNYNTNVSIYLSDILALILLLILLGKLARKQAKTSSFSAIMLPGIAWLLASAFSLVAAKDGELVLFQLIYMGKMIVLCWVVASSVKNDGDLTVVMAGLLFGMVFQSLVAIYQGVTGHPLGLGFLSEADTVAQQQLSQGLVNRVQGTLGSPNTLAIFLSTGVPFACAWVISKSKSLVKLLVAGALFLITWALIFSLSRTAWVNFIVTGCFVLVVAVRRKRISLKAAISLATVTSVVLMVVALFGSDLIMARLTSSDQGSTSSRLTMAKAALAIIQDNPVVGVGLNNYALVSPRYDRADAASWNHFTPIVHNAYLLIGAETGLIGLAAFLVFLAILMIQAWQIINRATSETMWVAGVGILGALIAMAIHSMVDYVLLGSGLVFTQFWLLAGLTAALLQRLNEAKTKPQPGLSIVHTAA